MPSLSWLHHPIFNPSLEYPFFFFPPVCTIMLICSALHISPVLYLDLLFHHPVCLSGPIILVSFYLVFSYRCIAAEQGMIIVV